MFERLLDRPPAQQQRPSLIVGEPRGLGDHPGAARDELVVRKLHVHHPVALDSPEADHYGRRKHVEHQFLCRTRLHAGRAGDKLRSDDRLERILRCGGSR